MLQQKRGIVFIGLIIGCDLNGVQEPETTCIIQNEAVLSRNVQYNKQNGLVQNEECAVLCPEYDDVKCTAQCRECGGV